VKVLDGGRSGDAGLGAENYFARSGEGGREVRGVFWAVLRDFRARAHKAHFTAQNINKLRKLVELRSAEPSADGCDSGVVGCGDRGAGCVVDDDHGAQLEDTEQFAALADARLAEEDGAAAGEPDGQSGEKEQGRGEDEEGERKDCVEPSLSNSGIKCGVHG